MNVPGDEAGSTFPYLNAASSERDAAAPMEA